MSKRDYYEILGVQKGASEEELKKAFRNKAKEHHPDRHAGDKGAEQKFKEINEAYEVLKDPQKRAAYDRFGHQAFEGGGFGNGRGGHPFGAGAQGAGGFDFGSAFGDIFEDLFGGFAGQGQRGGDPSAPSRGADLRYNMSIPLDEAFKGKQETIKFTTSVGCEVCHGSGAEKGSKPITCPTCNGAGRVRAQQGFFTIERSCTSCSGQGKIVKDPCKTCAGSGRVRKEKTLAVNIPAGVEEGTRIRLAGEGETGVRGGTPGDLYIFLSVKPHPLFKREGANIHCKVPVKFTTATLGGSIEVPTIDGSRVKINIPEGTQSGHQFRLKGKGMSVMRSNQRGDMYIHATVETPVHLSKKQKDLLREFESAGGKNTSPESEGFMSKVREFWADLKE